MLVVTRFWDTVIIPRSAMLDNVGTNASQRMSRHPSTGYPQNGFVPCKTCIEVFFFCCKARLLKVIPGVEKKAVKTKVELRRILLIIAPGGKRATEHSPGMEQRYKDNHGLWSV